jgi:tetratricopeptide (TPR) repeat protein
MSHPLLFKLFSNLYFFIVAAGICVLGIYFITTYRLSFNPEIVANGQDASLFTGCILFTVLILAGMLYRRFNFLFVQIFPLGIMPLLVAQIFGLTNLHSNQEYQTNLLLFILLYACLAALNVKQFHVILLIIICIWLFEGCIAYKQFFFNSHQLYMFSVTGTLLNSGVLACFLTIGLPLATYLIEAGIKCLSTFSTANKIFSRSSKEWNMIKWVMQFLLVVVVCVIDVIVKSRTALLGLTIGLLYNSYLHVKQPLKQILSTMSVLIKSIIVLLVLAVCIYAGYQMFFIKEMSAMGRVMKLEIAWKHLGDQFWWGTGFDQFTLKYPQWQMAYFHNTPIPHKKYFLTAEESFLLFNEPLQLFESIGFFRTVLLAPFLYLLFAAQSSRHPVLLINIKTALLITLVCSLTSYPLHVNVLLLILAVCCALIGKISTKNVIYTSIYNWLQIRLRTKYVFAAQFLTLIAIMLSVEISFAAFKRTQASSDALAIINSNDDFIIKKKKLDRLMTELAHNGKFLTQYGIFLKQDNAFIKKAICVLEQAKQHFISVETLLALGDAYYSARRYKEAQRIYVMLINFVPDNFGFRFKLLTVYIKMGDPNNVRLAARSILTMPVKIPSYTVDEIKERTRTIINQLNK